MRDSGIAVILDHHALPGVQTAGQQFAGQCTHDVQFYVRSLCQPSSPRTELVLTLVLDSDAIQLPPRPRLGRRDDDPNTLGSCIQQCVRHRSGERAHHERDTDPRLRRLYVSSPPFSLSCRLTSPHGAADQKNFVETIRAVELVLGIPVPGAAFNGSSQSANLTQSLAAVAASDDCNTEVRAVLRDAVPVLSQIGVQLSLPAIFDITAGSAPFHSKREPLVTK